MLLVLVFPCFCTSAYHAREGFCFPAVTRARAFGFRLSRARGQVSSCCQTTLANTSKGCPGLLALSTSSGHPQGFTAGIRTSCSTQWPYSVPEQSISRSDLEA